MQPMSQRPLVRGALDATGPAGGGAVMGTGIVSVALLLTGHAPLSRALMWIAAGLWAALALGVAARVVIDRPRLRREARLPVALTGVAGTAVVGVRFTLYGWSGAALVALVVAGALCAAVIGPVARNLGRRVGGGAFLVTVAVASLTELSAVVAAARGSGSLAVVAVILAGAALLTYPWVLLRFDFGEILRGAGDHWITGGALAICTVACDGCATALRATDTARGLAPTLDALAVILLVAALAWVPALVAGEIARPRLRYHVARWATVFPLGMYTAAAFQTGVGEGPRALTDLADGWVWVALAVWAAVALAGARHMAALMSDARRPAPP